MAAILNKSFKDWAAHQKYPMADDADFTSTDGRRVPLSFIIDAVLYPAVEGEYFISSMSGAGITVSNGDGWTALASMDDYARGWFPVKRYDNVVGCIVVNEEDFSYVRGLMSVHPMSFRPGRFSFAPGVVRSFCSVEEPATPNPTFFGQEVDSVNFELASPRFTQVALNTYDMDLETEAVTEHAPITEIAVRGTAYKLAFNGHLNIRTPIWCDDQFITQGDSIVLHRRGS